MACILVVEDEPAIRELLALVLGDEGHVVLTAPDGEAALTILQQQPVDLVLTDGMMPRLDGPGLIARLRAEPTLQLLPVILMSAVGPGVAPLAPGIAFLRKPFDLWPFLTLVQAALQGFGDSGAQVGEDEWPREDRNAGER